MSKGLIATPRLEISAAQWQVMQEQIIHSSDYQSIDLGAGFAFRFVDMHEQRENSYSALLSHKGLDVFHFMWTEVDGLANLTHRIVNPRYRGQGVGTRVMKALQQRLQLRAIQEQVPYLLMIETSQVSVVKLGQKVGMTLTKGLPVWETLQNYDIDTNTHVTDDNGYRMVFRVSQLIKPMSQRILTQQSSTRQQVLSLV